MSVRNCPPVAPTAAAVTRSKPKHLDFMVLIIFFRFSIPVCPLITAALQKVHSFAGWPGSPDESAGNDFEINSLHVSEELCHFQVPTLSEILKTRIHDSTSRRYRRRQRPLSYRGIHPA